MAEAFWRFSLMLYSRTGVADALLRLQDRDRCDVNLILFALWCGAVLRRRLDAAELAAAKGAADPVGRIVHPLRDLRRGLKPQTDPDVQALRRRLAMLELAIERGTQYRLASLVSGRCGEADPLAAASANLALYLGSDRAASMEAAPLRAAVAALARR